MFGDSYYIIRFIIRLFKKPSQHLIYWALEIIKKIELSVAYGNITWEAIATLNDMARCAPLYKGTVRYWDASILEEALEN